MWIKGESILNQCKGEKMIKDRFCDTNERKRVGLRVGLRGDRGETLSPLVSSSLSLLSLSFSLLSIKERDLVSRGRSWISRLFSGFDNIHTYYPDFCVFLRDTVGS